MKIYKNEVSLGLANQISNATTHVTASSFMKKSKETAQAKEFENYYSYSVPSDIMQLYAVLVSTVWNKNDDVFIQEEMYKSRRTPIMKPANMEHMGNENTENRIVGVINDAILTNDNLQRIDEDYDEINEKYTYKNDFKHIVTSIFLWEKYFPTTVENIKKGIVDNTMGVSMECIFKDFAYALQKLDDPKSEVMILERNDITSFLTGSLRVFGGSGTVEIDNEIYKVGRLLKDFEFSGIGFTDNPANEESIIFDNFISHAEIKDFNKISVLNNCKGDQRLWIF